MMRIFFFSLFYCFVFRFRSKNKLILWAQFRSWGEGEISRKKNPSSLKIKANFFFNSLKDEKRWREIVVASIKWVENEQKNQEFRFRNQWNSLFGNNKAIKTLQWHTGIHSVDIVNKKLYVVSHQLTCSMYMKNH